MEKEITSYPIELFEERHINFFQCPICLNVPNPENAHDHVHCGKLFCARCSFDWCLKHGTCPSCNQTIVRPIEELRLVKDLNKTVYQLMNCFRVKCPTCLAMKQGDPQTRVCTWQNELSLLAKHQTQCDFIVAECKWGCHTQMQRCDLRVHESTACRLRLVRCQHCNVELPFERLEGHERFECVSSPLTIVQCRYSEYGCQHKGARGALEQHEETELKQHFNLASAYAESLETMLEARNKSLLVLEEEASSEAHASRRKKSRGKKLVKERKKEKALSLARAQGYAQMPLPEEDKGNPEGRENIFFTVCRNNHALTNPRGSRRFECDACGKGKVSESLWECSQCQFLLCVTCATLQIPLNADCIAYVACPTCLSETRLLVYNTHNKYSSNYTCDVCKQANPCAQGRYYCVYCGFSVCPNCRQKPAV